MLSDVQGFRSNAVGMPTLHISHPERSSFQCQDHESMMKAVPHDLIQGQRYLDQAQIVEADVQGHEDPDAYKPLVLP